MKCRNRLLPFLIPLICLLILPFPVHAQQTLSGQALIEAIQQGGYNLYFRHEATDWSQQDAVQKGMIGKAAMEAGFVSYLNRGVKVPKEQGRRCEA